MTKQVQLSDEAYARLKRAKRPGDSFSDVILRAFPDGSLAELAMLGRTDEEMDEHLRLIREARRDDERSAKLDRWRAGDDA